MKRCFLGIENLESRYLLTPVVAIIDSGTDINHNASCIKLMFEEIGNYIVEDVKEGGRGTMVVRKI